MHVINGTRCALEALQASDKDGRTWLVVVAKATYRFSGGPGERPQLARRQRGLLFRDIFDGDDGRSSLRIENDFVPVKHACDVVVNGSAHAPHGLPVRAVDAGFAVGPIHKQIRVVGERRWKKVLGGYEPDGPEPFVTMPITYGRAFGGSLDGSALSPEDLREFLVHPANPVGRGFARGKFLARIEGEPVPNFEVPGRPVKRPTELYPPLSLGPIGRSWEPRLLFAGTYDQHWIDEIYPLLPSDFDERFYQCVPADQQMPYPSGGEEVTLHHLTPGDGLTKFRLPDLALPMAVLFRKRNLVSLAPVVDTLVIDADARTFDIVWRARTPLRRSLMEVDTVAAGRVCKRWWRSRVYGSADCGCSGVETDDNDLTPVTQALD